jgi:hypothetical protein
VKRLEGLAHMNRERIAGRRVVEKVQNRVLSLSRESSSLIAPLNDAAGQALRGRFLAPETSLGRLSLLRQIAEKSGIPVSIDQNRYYAFRRHDSQWSLKEELTGTPEHDPNGVANKTRE